MPLPNKDIKKTDSGNLKPNEKILAPWDGFDYVYIVVYNIHGQALGKFVHVSAMEEIMELGQSVYAGVCFSTIHGVTVVNPNIVKRYKFGSKYMKPDLSTLVPNATPVCRGNNIGHVICDLLHWDGSLDVSSPRTCALLQLDKLLKLGLTLKSGIEFKFTIKGLKSKADMERESRFAATREIGVYQELFLEFMDEMKNMGVIITSVQTDAGPSGFEFTCAPCDGILTADNTSRLRNALEVYLKRKGFEISYLTNFTLESVPVTQHYNFSLWKSDGTNAMAPVDGEKSADYLSDIGRHFLNGLCHHGPALAAFGLPTVHCYRLSRFKACPSYFNYGWNDKTKCVRLRGKEDNTMCEYRLASPQANPYLVFPSIVAAGIDGIIRKLEMPDPVLPVPGDLPSALSALKKDSVIMEAMGEELVNAFVYIKTTHEIEPLMAGETASDEEMLKREMEFY